MWLQRPRKSRLRELAYVAVALSLSACSTCDGCSPYRREWRQPADPVAEPSAQFRAAAAGEHADRPVRGPDTLRISVDADPVHLDPLVDPTVWTRRITRPAIFESLVRYAPPDGGAGSGPGTYEPGLASTWTVAPSGLEIRFDLQPDVLFHDGKPLSSVDVQFTLDTVRGANGPSDHLRRLLADVEAVELVGPRAVRVRLSRPNGYVLRALAEIPILPAHVYQHRLRASRTAPVVGTGPFRLASWQDDRITLERWDKYWGPAPKLARIELELDADAARALIDAKRGDVDLVPALIAAHYPEQLTAPGIDEKFARLDLRPPAFRYLAMDAGEPPFDDPRVRHAVVLLIQRKRIAEEVHHGLHRPVAGPVWPGGPGDGPSPQAPSYDPAEAYHLLDTAGWRDLDGDGKREKRGQRLSVSLLATDEDDPERDLIVGSLTRAGFRIDVRRGPAGLLLKRLEDHDFDLALVRWSGMVDDDLSPLLETGGALNYGRFSDAKVDRALAALRERFDPAARASAMGTLAQALAETWPIAPITAPDPHGLISARVHGAVVWDGWIDLTALSLEPPAE